MEFIPVLRKAVDEDHRGAIASANVVHLHSAYSGSPGRKIPAEFRYERLWTTLSQGNRRNGPEQAGQ
jgi:hypothetical protein